MFCFIKVPSLMLHVKYVKGWLTHTRSVFHTDPLQMRCFTRHNPHPTLRDTQLLRHKLTKRAIGLAFFRRRRDLHLPRAVRQVARQFGLRTLRNYLNADVHIAPAGIPTGVVNVQTLGPGAYSRSSRKALVTASTPQAESAALSSTRHSNPISEI